MVSQIRWLLPVGAALAGAATAVFAYLLPAHLGAVDSAVLNSLSSTGPSLEEIGRQYLRSEKVGPAQSLLRALELENAPAAPALKSEVFEVQQRHPQLRPWGGADPRLERLLQPTGRLAEFQGRNLAALLLDPDSRAVMRTALAASRRGMVLDLLSTVSVPGTQYFSPAASASGQPLEAAIVLTALLLQEDYFAAAFQNSIRQLTVEARTRSRLGALEDAYLHLLSLCLRLDWVSFTEFIKDVPDLKTLKILAEQTRDEVALTSVAAAVYVSQAPAQVAQYLAANGPAALADLRFGAVRGRAALAALLQTEMPVHYGPDRAGWLTRGFVAVFGSGGVLALSIRWALLGGGLFLLFWGATRAMRRAGRAGPGRAGAGLRAGLWALGSLVLVVLLDESLLVKAGPTTEPPLRWQFSAAGATLKQTKLLQPIMDKLSVFALVGFLLIQVAIYILCLLKLGEIRRQAISSGVKLRLLENEENMFDAGLYVGLAGTVFSLLFLALGIIKPSLVAAYSSTLFGILFVAVLKICHVRPLRRKLILENSVS